MTLTIIPEADIRRELRQMLAKEKAQFLDDWAAAITKVKDQSTKAIAEAQEQGQPEHVARIRIKYAEAIEKMEAKPQEVEGIYEQFFAFIDNAQFPEGAP
ncbi:MAG: hypothetical protein QNI87_01655 [Erythrobacter sp.]|uniref:hypothetical protein n=1 Tax=Erythrobacter sp. TaxID=1042 RepID=UPI00263869A9|nr:hypothetical protein [Erythrobacter sp.]MDJ0977220.1 hypothetical protein [Erythrobacter sp.]